MYFLDWAISLLRLVFYNAGSGAVRGNSPENDIVAGSANKRVKLRKCGDNQRTTNILEKFRLLMWKNFLLQYRHKTQTIIQILMPILFTANLILIRSFVEPEVNRDNTTYNSFEIDTLSVLRSVKHDIHLKEWKLVFSPRNNVLEKLLNETTELLPLNGIESVNTAEEVETVMLERELLAGVLFDHPANITELPRKLVYTLRFPSECRINAEIDPSIYNWHTNLHFPIFSGGGPRGKSSDEGGAPSYFLEGFLTIQDAIARSFIKMKCSGLDCENNRIEPKIRMQRFPYPPYIQDVLLDALDTAVALFIMLSFVYPLISTVRVIAVEKEKQLKEVMKIMGMPNWLHWTSWFLRTMVFMVISIFLMVGLLKVSMFDSSTAIFTHSNWFVIWIFLIVYSIPMTTYCFMLSVLFSRANTAAAVAGLLWFVSYMPYAFLALNHLEIPLAAQIFASISPNVAMAFGCQMIMDFERSGVGLQWSNLWDSSINGSNLTVGITICCMLVTSIMFALIALYAEIVFPGKYGVPEKWNFPFKKEFWFGKGECNFETENHDRLSSQQFNGNENFEEEPHSMAGVKVKNLRKVFGNGRAACNGLTFNMFTDQITVLLGHNGAGKSTLMSMLTGMIPPTEGTAIVNGWDIRTDLKKARSFIGICPQHNILFDELTVSEHIEFYSRLKGLKKSAVQDEVKRYVTLLNLESKINSISQSLSGGMQRKLSFGVALCGGSKVVLCDEPTSGMDADSRRELWDILQSEKRGRTIVLTTHFMDEADVLGDRIAIMADGELKCCGSSFFLKKRFGNGYRLICVKEDGCDSSAVSNLLHKCIPEIKMLDDIGGVLSFALPYEHAAKFGELFDRLETELHTLKLQRISVSSTELEEVFLKVGSNSKLRTDETINETPTQNGYKNIELSNVESNGHDLLSGFRLQVNQWIAMFKKRYYCWTHNWILFFLQNLITIVFIVLSVVFVRIAKGFNVLPKLEISLTTYDETVTMLQTPQFNNSEVQSIVTEYRKDFDQESVHILDEFSEDIQTHFLRFSDLIRIPTHSRFLVGLSTFDNASFTVWMNNQLFHTAPLSLNLLHNAIIRANLGADNGIAVSNWPIAFRPESKALLTVSGNDMGSQLATNLSFAMAFTTALYVMFYIRERASKAKLLQFISGVNTATFWMASFLFDFAAHVLTCLFFWITVYAFQEEGWSTIQQLTPLFVLLVVFGFSVLAISIVSSYLFSQASYGYVSLAIFFVFTGITFFNVIKIMMLPVFNLTKAADILKMIFLAFPHYALGYSFFNLNQISIAKEVCRLQCKRFLICDPESFCAMSAYDWLEPGIGRSLTYMAAVGIIFFFILSLIEYKIFSGVLYYIRGFSKRQLSLPPVTQRNMIDNDVSDEIIRVNAMSSEDLQANNVVVRNLTKYYDDVLAVNGICVAVRRAECFGLIGVNGAGKTSTFKMVTGDASISSGDVFICGINLKTNLTEAHKMCGYCPQFDALLDELTGSQTLEIFGLIRGYRRAEISDVSARLANDLNFTKHIDKRVKNYSGGNKRKLSTAIAIMGNPAVVYLDEPSSGMDPGGMRNLWSIVSRIRTMGTSVVLTSHSMQECEAVCTRLAIMVGGEFKCLGSPEHLKNKFCNGFLLTIKVRSGWSQRTTHLNSQMVQIQINNFIYENFPGARLKENYEGLVTYHVPQTKKLKWSTMFNRMETAKRILKIEDYSIAQATLEEVFLSFSKFHRKKP